MQEAKQKIKKENIVDENKNIKIEVSTSDTKEVSL